MPPVKVTVTAPAHRYVASTHTPSGAGNGGHHGSVSQDDLQERCHRLTEENRQLKVARNQQDQQLKDLTAQFARLKRDLKIATPRSSEGGIRDENFGASSTDQVRTLQKQLASMTKQRDDALAQVAELTAKLARFRGYDKAGISGVAAASAPVGHTPSPNSAAPASLTRPRYAQSAGAVGLAVSVVDILTGATAPTPSASMMFGGAVPHDVPSAMQSVLIPPAETIPLQAHRSVVQDLQQRGKADASRIKDLMHERDALRAQLDSAASRSTAPSPMKSRPEADRAAVLEAEAASLRQRFADLQSKLEAVSLERDRLLLEVKTRRAASPVGSQYRGLEPTSQGAYNFATTADASCAPTFPRAGGDASYYVTHQAHGIDAAVSEQTAQLTVLARRFEDAQSHALSLQQECERLVGELRTMHNSNAEEKRRIFSLEHEKATLTVKAARTDELERALTLRTEEHMRCEQELLKMVDKLQSCSREIESQLRLEYNTRLVELEAMREDADRSRRAAEREMHSLKIELQETKRLLEASREDTTHFRTRFETASNERTDLASRLASHVASHPVTSAAAEETVARLLTTAEAERRAELNDLNDGSQWDEKWELNKLREAMATATLDLELAESRAQAFERDAKLKTGAVVTCTKQRDELLEENLQLREQISGIKTSLVRRERAVLDDQAGKPASVTLTVDSIKSDAALLGFADADVDGTGGGVPVTLFLTVDGFPGFEAAVSDMFHTANGEVLLPFVFGGFVVNPAELKGLATERVNLQLHRSTGLESAVVGSASLPIGRLFGRCLEDAGDATLLVPLLDGTSERVAHVTLRVQVSHIALALAVLRPDDWQGGEGPRLTRPLQTSAHALATLGKTDVAQQLNAWLLAFRAVRGIRVSVLRCQGLTKNTKGIDPTPYVFYTATDGGIGCVVDTVVHTRNRLTTCDPTFDGEPTDHPAVVRSSLLSYLRSTVLTFVVFDAQADDAETNLGSAIVSLARLAESPTTTLYEELTLHPAGKLFCTVSWVL
jgi:hypothetical protein